MRNNTLRTMVTKVLWGFRGARRVRRKRWGRVLNRYFFIG